MDSINKSFDITVILNAHAEGRLAHRSVRSVQWAIKYALSQGINVEFLAVVDSCTAKTKAYFERNADLFDSVIYVDYKDPAQARNHGVKIARGEYISFLDADDLFSETWLAKANQFAKKLGDRQAILHPCCSVYFGEDHRIFWHMDSTCQEFDPKMLIFENLWTALCFAPRQVLLDNPNSDSVLGSGFGHEDWHWNCETIAQGIPHLIVPETVQFVRIKKRGSRNTAHTKLNARLRRTSLFTREFLCKPTDVIDSEHAALPGVSRISLFRRFLTAIYRALRLIYRRMVKHLIKNPHRISLAMSYTRLFFNALFGKPMFLGDNNNIPKWLIDQWCSINTIDPSVVYARDSAKTQICTLTRWRSRNAYVRLLAAWPEDTTHVILLPWLVRGGSDLEALHYIDVLAADSSNKVLCILTEEGRVSPWISRLPQNVDVINFGEITAGLPMAKRVDILTTLMIQETPRVIHNLNSPVAYDMFIDYGKTIAQSSRIYNSVFCTEFDANGAQVGYAVNQLDSCFDVSTKVFSDNTWFIEHLINIYDFNKDRFIAHNMPPDKMLKMISPEIRRRPGDPMNVLWASRLDRQKRIDVLAKIVDQCKNLPITFHVYGSSLNPVEDKIINSIKKSPNVNFAGPYDGFGSLPVHEMDAYLYTTSWDGTPNVILEATMCGLPIIAPPVGGIPEVLACGAGFLVANPDDVEGFIAALKQILDSPELGMTTVKMAQNVIATRHSWESFRSAVLAEPGYCKAD